MPEQGTGQKSTMATNTSAASVSDGTCVAGSPTLLPCTNPPKPAASNLPTHSNVSVRKRNAFQRFYKTLWSDGRNKRTHAASTKSWLV